MSGPEALGLIVLILPLLAFGVPLTLFAIACLVITYRSERVG
jgi:hypothetical protein